MPVGRASTKIARQKRLHLGGSTTKGNPHLLERVGALRVVAIGWSFALRSSDFGLRNSTIHLLPPILIPLENQEQFLTSTKRIRSGFTGWVILFEIEVVLPHKEIGPPRVVELVHEAHPLRWDLFTRRLLATRWQAIPFSVACSREGRATLIVGLVYGVTLGHGVVRSFPLVGLDHGMGVALLHSRIFHGQRPPPEHCEFKT
ncbi:UNVERIFIED_CONTAM: hypothetical protein Sindi_0840400 [Sesamum indicum]